MVAIRCDWQVAVAGAIKSLAEMIKEVVGYPGEITHDLEKPDGTPRKLMDVSRIHNLGWKHEIDLKKGIEMVYAEMKDSAIFNSVNA